jgi:hypothetical protein
MVKTAVLFDRLTSRTATLQLPAASTPAANHRVHAQGFRGIASEHIPVALIVIFILWAPSATAKPKAPAAPPPPMSRPKRRGAPAANCEQCGAYCPRHAHFCPQCGRNVQA